MIIHTSQAGKAAANYRIDCQKSQHATVSTCSTSQRTAGLVHMPSYMTTACSSTVPKQVQAEGVRPDGIDALGVPTPGVDPSLG